MEKVKTIKENFKRHGLSYTLIKRNDKLCIYGVSGIYTDKILHYEVMLIRIRNNEYGHREAIPSDEEFGRTANDLHFQTLEDAERYFALWEARILITGTTKHKKGTQLSLEVQSASIIQ